MLIEKLSAYLDRSIVATNQKCCHIQLWGQSYKIGNKNLQTHLSGPSRQDLNHNTTPSSALSVELKYSRP